MSYFIHHIFSMKQFFKWLGKHIASALIFSVFSILFIAGIVYALTFPSTPPTGEVAGGKFTVIFNNILQSGNYATDTTGKVKLATLSDNTTNL